MQQTLRAEVNLPPRAYGKPDEIALYVDRALPALEAIPGIDAVAAAQVLPFTDSVRIGSELTFADGQKVQVLFHWNAVTPDYFRAMDIPIIGGRTFDAADRGTEKVAIVNRAFVTHYLGQRPPVGLQFGYWRGKDVQFRIVGIVEGTENVSVGEDDRPQLYEPLARWTATGDDSSSCCDRGSRPRLRWPRRPRPAGHRARRRPASRAAIPASVASPAGSAPSVSLCLCGHQSTLCALCASVASSLREAPAYCPWPVTLRRTPRHRDNSRGCEGSRSIRSSKTRTRS